MAVAASSKQGLTEQEKRWVKMLEGDPLYEMALLSEFYATDPDPRAAEAVAERFGDPQGAAWCKFYMAHQLTEIMRDTVVLLHGPMNCIACSRSFHSWLSNNYGCGMAPTPSTAIDQRHVVFGGEESLYNAIKAVERDYKPKLIVIMTGCAPSLVQDDVPRVVERTQEEVGAKLFYIPTSGYEAVTYGQMIEEVSRVWIDLMDPPTKVDKEAVNIVGVTREPYFPHVCLGQETRRYPGDADELGRYIEGLGLKVHRVLLGGDYEYVRTAAEAGVNTVYCGTWGFPLAQEMEKRFGTPYTGMQLPLGVESTSAWIRELARLTGREEEAERLIKKEYEEIEDVYERCKEVVRGKVVILGGIMNRTCSWLRFCKELGMEIIFVNSQVEMGVCGFWEVKAKWFDTESFLKYGFDPLTLRTKHRNGTRDLASLRIWKVMERLGISEDDAIYMFTDMTTFVRSGVLDPSNIAFHMSSTHMRRRPGYPSRAAGFKGAAGWCLDLIEAVKAAQRKGSPTLLGRVHGNAFDF